MTKALINFNFISIGSWLGLIITVFACSPQKQDQGTTENKIVTTSYTEPHRPQFHFSPDSMWMNDPNGMVYYDGEYHLFYQHYPDSTVWGPMHWGHAISEDLVHWKHMPIALYPDEHGYIFSGSAVLDENNTSGLGTEDNPPLVAIFTYHDPEGAQADNIDFQTQGIAYSTDKGRTWSKYENNPVLENPGIRDFRDPKVMWYEPSEKWIMTLAVKDHIEFYSSPDLIDWKKESEFGKTMGAHGGVWECPDLFEMEVEGSDGSKWVLFVSINPGGPNGGSATQYFVGEFDGTTFTPDDQETRWLDYGPDNYAGVTWSNVEDRRIFIGWMSNWLYANIVPTHPWRSAMTLPRRLTMSQNDYGYIVRSVPVAEFEIIKGEARQLSDKTIEDSFNLNQEIQSGTALFELSFVNENASGFEVELSNDMNEKLVIGFDAKNNHYFIDRRNAGKTDFHNDFGAVHTAPRLSTSEVMDIRIVVDKASVELFTDNGSSVMTAIFFAEKPLTNINMINSDENNLLAISKLNWTPVQSIW